MWCGVPFYAFQGKPGSNKDICSGSPEKDSLEQSGCPRTMVVNQIGKINKPSPIWVHYFVYPYLRWFLILVNSPELIAKWDGEFLGLPFLCIHQTDFRCPQTCASLNFTFICWFQFGKSNFFFHSMTLSCQVHSGTQTPRQSGNKLDLDGTGVKSQRTRGQWLREMISKM